PPARHHPRGPPHQRRQATVRLLLHARLGRPSRGGRAACRRLRPGPDPAEGADPHPGARGALGMGVDGELGPDRWRLRSDRPDRPEPRARGARAGRRRPRRVTNPVRAIGVDVGGTFTDLALWDDERGALAVFKLPSVPHDPALGILEGLRTLTAREGVDPETLTFVAHGT